MNVRNTLLAGAIFGLLGVAFGAFGAHALKPMFMESGRLETFELAVRYQFYHAFALSIAGILQHILPSRFFRLAALAFLTGIVLFSGSLYVLCLTGINGIGLVTPFGGVAFMLGWIVLITGLFKSFK